METLTINSIITDSPAPVAILDTEMRFIAHSDVWRETFVSSSDSIIGKSYYEALPNLPDIFRKIHKDCLKGTSNENKGKKFVSQNGAVQWLKWKIKNWKSEDGKIGGIIVVQEDITEAKRREELLQIAESVARIGGWEVDMATNTVYWTQVTEEIHEVPEGYIPNLEEGINFYKAGAHREKITQLVSDSMADGKPWDTELIIVTAKGNELWVRSKGEAEIVDGKCVRIYGTFQDIDEKKKTELNFLEATERLEIATKGAKIGIWDYDILQNKLVWDDNMYRLYNIDKKDFNGEYEAWQSGLHPDDKEPGALEIEKAITGEKEFDTEFRVIWPNGEIRHIRALAVTQRDSDGKAIKMTGTNWDITDRIEAEKKLQKLVEVTTDQNESLLNFAHIVSHNLRSHSANLSMLTGFLGKEQDIEEQKNLIRMLSDASSSLNETILHLNEVVQVRADALEKMKFINLYDTLENVQKNLSVLVQEKNVKYSIDIPKKLKVRGIPAYLDSIFLNLITNSIKYSSPERSPKIKIKAQKIENKIKITFTDNGLGIDLDRHGDKLFGMYKTFHRNKDAKGIGLFITKNQMEAMNGKIEVASKVDEGTTFTLCFDAN